MIDYQINLDRAYAIRAEMIAFIDDKIADGQSVPQSAVIDEMLARHADVSRHCIEHLAERVSDHWGMPGLDYHEAPFVPGHSTIRAWYPVERDGQLQRVALDEPTRAEFAAITAALRQQGVTALARAELLRS